jgi:hypothetical protein
MTDQPTPSPKPPISAGGVILLIVGGVLLVFPGGCSLLALGATLYDRMTRTGSGGGYNFDDVIIVISLIGLAVALFGFFIMRLGLRLRNSPSTSA